MSGYALALLALGAISTPPDGSLIVFHDDKKPVAAYTGSDITHVAIVLHVGDQPMVYEAMPAHVRRVPLSAYFDDLARLKGASDEPAGVLMLQPKQSYKLVELYRMQVYLESQVGRPYSVKGYVRKRQAQGIHCAEFVSTALNCTGRYEFDERYAISPGELIERVKPVHEPVVVSIAAPHNDASWCLQTWQRWLLVQTWCAWAWWEAWRFCR